MARHMITRELAFAAGQDAANRAMAKRLGQKPRSPKRWTAEEADLAAAKTNQLLLYVPFAQGGFEGLNLSPKMRDDLGIADEWRNIDKLDAILPVKPPSLRPPPEIFDTGKVRLGDGFISAEFPPLPAKGGA